MESAELTKSNHRPSVQIRFVQDKPVPEAILIQAVETATWAPNGSVRSF